VLIDGWGWCWEDESGREGGVEVEEVELRTFNATYHVIMSTHDHTIGQLVIIVSRRRSLLFPYHHHPTQRSSNEIPPPMCPSPRQGCGPVRVGENTKGTRS